MKIYVLFVLIGVIVGFSCLPSLGRAKPAPPDSVPA